MKIIDNFFKRSNASEVFTAQILNDEFQGKKLHLRIDKKGNGTLTVNAARILYLNKVSTDYIKFLLMNQDDNFVIESILKKYLIDEETARQDFKELKETIIKVTDEPDVCPVTYLDVDTQKPFSQIKNPLRVDFALTYRCDNNCSHCYVARSKNMPEMTTEEWKKVIDIMYDLGIPNITFTGGEATLRDDLIQLIAHSQDIGIICGLVTNGRKLKEKSYVDQLVSAGLDYFQITLESYDREIHNQMVGVKGAWEETVQGIKNAIATPIYTLTNTTLTALNAPDIDKTIDFLGSLEADKQHLKVFAMNGLIYSGKAIDRGSKIGIREEDLGPIVDIIVKKAEENNMRFIWYTPTEYCVLDPLSKGLGIKRCSAASISICIEPNGDVIPCQSYYEAVGNILKENWNKIWNSKLFKNIRNRKYVQTKCKNCPDLSTCGGGCPLYLKNKNLICGNIGSSP